MISLLWEERGLNRCQGVYFVTKGCIAVIVTVESLGTEPS